MPEIVEQLKEPFDTLMNERLTLLNTASDQIETHKDTINLWPTRKKKLSFHIIETLQKRVSLLKRMNRPFNLKHFFREKKRMNRSRFWAWFQGTALLKKLKYSFMSSGNFLKTLLFLILLVGIIVLLVWLIGKIIGSIDAIGKFEW